MEPEPTPIEERPFIIQVETPTGQSRLAYRLAAALLLMNVAFGLAASMAAGAAAAPSVLVIDSALAVGLIDLRRGARELVLIRASMGVVFGAVLVVLFLLRAEQPIAAVAAGALSQLAYAASIALLLLGKSKPWRIALAIGIFVFGLASARLWEPFVGAAAGQTSDGTKVAIDVLLALAIAELVAATAIKQMAQESQLSRLAMYVLAIISVVTMVGVASLIGIAESVEVFVVTILWPVAAVVVLVQDRERKRFLLYGLAVLGALFWIVLLFSFLLMSKGT